MPKRKINISRIVETIKQELGELDAHMTETAGRKLDARASRLLRVQFVLRQTVAALEEECPPLSDEGEEGFIPELGS